jgi:hypothetical protein
MDPCLSRASNISTIIWMVETHFLDARVDPIQRRCWDRFTKMLESLWPAIVSCRIDWYHLYLLEYGLILVLTFSFYYLSGSDIFILFSSRCELQNPTHAIMSCAQSNLRNTWVGRRHSNLQDDTPSSKVRLRPDSSPLCYFTCYP